MISELNRNVRIETQRKSTAIIYCVVFAVALYPLCRQKSKRFSFSIYLEKWCVMMNI